MVRIVPTPSKMTGDVEAFFLYFLNKKRANNCLHKTDIPLALLINFLVFVVSYDCSDIHFICIRKLETFV